MSFYDKLDDAYERYKARHRNDEKLVDDVDPTHREPCCPPCDQGLTHIMPCTKESAR